MLLMLPLLLLLATPTGGEPITTPDPPAPGAHPVAVPLEVLPAPVLLPPDAVEPPAPPPPPGDSVPGFEVVITANGRDADVTDCQAPCAVHFTALPSTIHPVLRPAIQAHDQEDPGRVAARIDYQWDFGESTNPRRWGEQSSSETAWIGECNGCTSVPVMDVYRNDPRARHDAASLARLDDVSAWLQLHSRNEYHGAGTTSHLFEIPGTYQVSLTATDAQRATAVGTRKVTVVDAYGPERVYCFSADPEEGWAGCPVDCGLRAGQCRARVATLDAVRAACEGGCKYLLQRGDRFDASGTESTNWSGSDSVAAFGDGPPPVVAHPNNGRGEPFRFGGGLRVTDLVVDYGSGPYFDRTMSTFACTPRSLDNPFTLVRVRVLGGGYQVSCNPGMQLASIYDSSFIGAGGKGGDGYNVYGFSHGFGGFQHVGNYHGAYGDKEQDPMRMPRLGKFLVLQFSVLDGLAQRKNSGYRLLHHGSIDSSGMGVIGYNAFTRNRSFQLNRVAPNEDFYVHDMVFESNYFPGYSGEPARPGTQRGVIRNNFGWGRIAAPFVARADGCVGCKAGRQFDIGDLDIVGNTWVRTRGSDARIYFVRSRDDGIYGTLPPDRCFGNVVVAEAEGILSCGVPGASSDLGNTMVQLHRDPCPLRSCAPEGFMDLMLGDGTSALGAGFPNGGSNPLLQNDALGRARAGGTTDPGALQHPR